MGPVIFITGNAATSATSVSAAPVASMGPVIFITGNSGTHLTGVPPLLASMGPVIFITGKRRLRRQDRAI